MNGQKIWTSEAHHANWIFVLVRTDPDAPKHKGLTLLACPLEQPGIEIRPIRQIHGNAGFNEVFFTDATTTDFHTIGPVNDGWRVAMSLLEFERGGAAAVFAARFEEELLRLTELAATHGKLGDTEIRRTLAWLKGRVTAMRMLGYRALTKSLDGNTPGPESAMTKLYWTECHNVVTELSLRILGARALVPKGRMPTIVDGPDAPGATQDPGSWVGAYLASRASTIYAGTNQIQRNILAERVLGMPR
ncbi:MAG: acyl-CoA dehydrogenase family protein [Cumulibacter sp.]